MAEYTIDKIEYGGNVYKLQDNVSGYATGTIPTKTSELTNDGDGTSNFATMADIGSLGGGTVTSIVAGTGLITSDSNPITSSGTIKAKLNSETSLGTIGSTSKLYAVGVDSNGQLGVKVPWANDQVYTIDSNSSNDLFLTGTSSSSTSTGYLYKDSSAWISVTADDVTDGQTNLFLGNNTASTLTGGKRGAIYLYGTGTVYTALTALATSTARYISLPNNSGTIALTSDIPSITLNGSSTTSPSFYAPTTAGTSGYYLKSNGSGAPTWTAAPTIPSNNVTGSGIVSHLAVWSGTNTLSNTSLPISSSYNSSSDLYGTIQLHVGDVGQINWKGQLVFYCGSSSKTITITPPSITADRIITLPDKTGTIALTSDIPTVTDKKLEVAAVTSGTTYYPIVGTGTTAATRQFDTTGFQYKSTDGTAGESLYGMSLLTLGNTKNSTQDGWKQGTLRLCGINSYYTELRCNTNLAQNSTITLPNASGAIALTSDIPTKTSDLTNDSGFITVSDIPTIPSITLNGSSTTSPSFYAPTGAGTSGQYLKSNGSGAPSWTNFPTIPSITLNGSSTTSPSFYAPISVGTSGNYLKSSGSGAPTWEAFPTIPSISLNGSSTTSPSFYAPTSAGTNGYYLTSNGSGAPSWTSFPTTISILQANVIDTNDTSVGSITLDSNNAVEINNHNTSTKAVLDGGFSIVGSSGEIFEVGSSGNVNTLGGIYLPNAKYLYGTTTGGDARLVCGINSNDQYMFGYDSYYRSEGASYFDGNSVNIRSKENINVTGEIMILTGQLRVQGHATQIGYQSAGTRSSSAGSVGTTYSTVATISLAAGTWLITGYNSFNGGTAGTRRILITTSSTGTTDAAEGSASCYAGSSSQIVVSTAIIVSPTAQTTYYLRCKSSVTVDSPYGNLRAVRIA